MVSYAVEREDLTYSPVYGWICPRMESEDTDEKQLFPVDGLRGQEKACTGACGSLCDRRLFLF